MELLGGMTFYCCLAERNCMLEIPALDLSQWSLHVLTMRLLPHYTITDMIKQILTRYCNRHKRFINLFNVCC